MSDPGAFADSIGPLVGQAVNGAITGDARAVATAWKEITSHGEKAVYGAFAALAVIALSDVRRTPGSSVTPKFVHRTADGTEPLDPDAPELAVEVFCARFVAASFDADNLLQQDLYFAFTRVDGEPRPDMAQRTVEASLMLTRSAAEATVREAMRHKRSHQHPNARRRPHRRDQRRR